MNHTEDLDHTVVVTTASDETVVVTSASPTAPPVAPTAPPASLTAAPAAPTAPPWQIDAPIERGVSQALPVRYPARPYQVSEPRHGLDEVQRRIGAAPAASPVAVRQGREGLPSLERRTRRGRMVTLILFGVVLLGSIAGLWVLASIAFGW